MVAERKRNAGGSNAGWPKPPAGGEELVIIERFSSAREAMMCDFEFACNKVVVPGGWGEGVRGREGYGRSIR